jgi:Lrp/AsnC family leucine-responsive transcriptional regulator
MEIAIERRFVHALPMDHYDRKLLTLLQEDSRLTAVQLAERLHLSSSSITRRIQRLWSDGTISSAGVVLGERLRSTRIAALIHVQLDRHRPSDLDLFKRHFRQTPEVQMLVEITGSADVMMMVSVRDMAHFNNFSDQLADHPLVRRYETSFIKKVTKFTTTIPLETEEK